MPALLLDDRVPDDATARAVRDLAAGIEQADGAPPLSDQARTRLTSPTVTHVVARCADEVCGYAQLDGSTAEIAATPDVVAPVLDAVLASGAEPRIWTHGHRSRLIAEFERRGFTRVRELHQLRRDLADLPADPPLDAAVTIRPFTVGADETAWLQVNAVAFAAHPEQGRTTLADLQARQSEGWFDPAGFLLAERDTELLGFHWTKTHPDCGGEVYVLGVSPSAQGLGLGRALLIRGLRHLGDVGCSYALLYVDGDNPGAMRLYERDGFVRFDLDVQWSTG